MYHYISLVKHRQLKKMNFISFMNLKYVFFLITLLNSVLLYGQKEVKKDSIDIYQKVETYSKQRKSTKAIHKLFFKSSRKGHSNSENDDPENYYKDYHGKPIRRILIKTLDPFGYSVYDTVKGPKNWLAKVGNSTHIKSYKFAIKNLLLFKEKQRKGLTLFKKRVCKTLCSPGYARSNLLQEK